MELGIIISFLGASILLALMPGPDNIFVLTESITKGHKRGIAISVGLSLGVIIHTIAAATGLSIIIQKSALAFSIIKYLGVAYLIYLAYKATKEKNDTVDLVNKTKNKPEKQIFASIRKGFLMNVLNPKVALFFIAFLPQFIATNGINITLQMIILGIIFSVQTLIIFISVALLSSKLTKYVSNPKFWNITKWSKAGVLSALAIALAISKR